MCCIESNGVQAFGYRISDKVSFIHTHPKISVLLLEGSSIGEETNKILDKTRGCMRVSILRYGYLKVYSGAYYKMNLFH